jgi:haloalkane dehalogenase/tRNA(adenine34) deaminase
VSILRTPDERFANLPGYAFAPHYLEAVGPGPRMHYLDEGPRSAMSRPVTFLCLHGQPTWSYLYRRMIPRIVAAGHRAVAPDLIGFGRSDKPEDDAFYTFSMHRRSLMDFVERLDLKNVVLVCQDWGGLLGLTLPPDSPTRFQALLVMNTGFGAGDVPLGKGFLDWRAWNNANPDMAIGRLIQRGTPHLTPAESAAYDAPFPDVRFKAGVRRFPNLVPDNPDADGAALSRAAREWWRTQWNGRTFMAVGMKDPVLGPPAMTALRANIRNCPAPFEVAEGGHFVQEWSDQFIDQAIAALMMP